MKAIELLLQDVQSTDPRTRDLAALDLMDIGDERAIHALWAAIERPENVNHRGTLVYALSAFDPSTHLESLVMLALTGNFEVSLGAVSILDSATHPPESLERIRVQLARHPADGLTEGHHTTALRALRELIQIE